MEMIYLFSLFLLPVSCVQLQESAMYGDSCYHAATRTRLCWQRHPNGCWCDSICSSFGDCCYDVCAVCPQCVGHPSGQFYRANNRTYLAGLLNNCNPPRSLGTPAPSWPWPTPAPTTFASGDPHVANIRGERFDIKRVGWHKLVQIPRVSASPQGVQFRVDVDVEPRQDICGELYIQKVQVSGNQVKHSSNILNFTLGDGLLGSELLVNGMPVVEAHIPGILVTDGGKSVGVNVGNTVSYLDIARAGCCYHYLNFKISMAKSIGTDIGGLLGQDAHSEAATKPWQCKTESIEFATCTDPHNSLQSNIDIFQEE